MPEAATVLALRQTQTLGTQAAALLATAPMLVLAPLNYTIVNLRPFDIQVYVYSPSLFFSGAWRFGWEEAERCHLYRAEAVDFVGLIYLLILSVCRPPSTLFMRLPHTDASSTSSCFFF